MTDVVFYFQVHQPFRLRRYTFFDIAHRDDYFDDAENERILQMMDERARGLAELGFAAVRCETLREDWPEERAPAEARIRTFVEEESRAGRRVLVVPFRLAGFGPHREVLEGLEYTANERGFCPHENLTRWITEAAEQTFAGT